MCDPGPHFQVHILSKKIGFFEEIWKIENSRSTTLGWPKVVNICSNEMKGASLESLRWGSRNFWENRRFWRFSNLCMCRFGYLRDPRYGTLSCVEVVVFLRNDRETTPLKWLIANPDISDSQSWDSSLRPLDDIGLRHDYAHQKVFVVDSCGNNTLCTS